MKNFKLKNDLIVPNWLLSTDSSANIQRNYFQAIKALCGFVVKRLINIFWKPNRKLSPGLLMRQMHTKTYLISFKKSLLR